MGEGLTGDPSGAAAAIFVACVLVLRHRLGWGTALWVSAVKSLLPWLFFAYLDDGGWRHNDDVTYAAEATELLAQGWTPMGLLTDPASSAMLFAAAGGRHVGYYWFNALAQALFGTHYFAPIFLNVFVSALGGLGFWRLVRAAGCGPGYARGALVFFLLHWDVLAWSSFVNLKDTLVLALSVWVMAASASFVRRPSLRSVAALAALFAGLFFVRWYVLTLFVAAIGTWGVLHLRGRKRLGLVLAGLGVVLFQWQYARRLDLVHPGMLLGGSLRFLFTPRPWGIQPSYGFLTFPALLHWLLAPVSLWGAIRLWRRSPVARATLLYLAVVVAFYAMVPHVQGPRHRVQVTFAIAWIQFHGLYILLMDLAGKRGAAEREPSPEPRLASGGAP